MCILLGCGLDRGINPEMTRIKPLNQPPDRTAFACGIRPLDHNDRTAPGILERMLQLQQPQMPKLHFPTVLFRRLTFCLVKFNQTDGFFNSRHAQTIMQESTPWGSVMVY